MGFSTSVTDLRPNFSAYSNAWRQMLFYLSLCEVSERGPFLQWVWGEFAPLAAGKRGVAALRPALVGLNGVIAGQRFDAKGRMPNGRRFLGWTVGQHWLMGG